jgi:hypothetical protein
VSGRTAREEPQHRATNPVQEVRRIRVRAVRDAFFFLSVAGLALSVAGFAGLVSAFRGRDQGWTRTELWRLRMIAQLSFLLVFVALVQFPLYALSGDEALVIRIAAV